MKREVRRERVLPAFRLDLPEVDLLWRRCVELFDDPDRIHTSLTIELPRESLEFQSYEELRAYEALPSEFGRFSLWASQHGTGRRVHLRTNTLLGTRPEVSATGESDAWCAGAVETVHAFLANHRTKYDWFVAAPLGWLLVALVVGLPVGAYVATRLTGADVAIPRPVAYGWLGTVGAISLLYAARARLFPTALVTVRDQPGFFRRHTAELSLLVAVVSAVLTVIGWFVAK